MVWLCGYFLGARRSLAAGVRDSAAGSTDCITPVVIVSIFRACRAVLLLCTAPGPELLAMVLLFVCLSLLLPVLLSAVFFSKLVRFLGEQVGHYLRRSCRTRRELLLARVANESESFKAEHVESEEHGWEEIASVGASNKQDEQWEGIIGFFHPFW